jgi:gluconolactonase
MKNRLLFIFLILPLLAASQIKESYPTDSASIVRSTVPHGEVLKFTFHQSKIFPGTWREYWVYVPAQYKPSQPACVYVGQDGLQNNANVVFDNLIHNKQMPITIGVFVMPGRVPATDTNSLDRFNRSFEYDGLGDAYARFLLTEILPDVETRKATDGRAIVLSKSGNDRAIGGASSGAICAFTVAWERPQEFSRVFSAIGTYTGLRGAANYPTLIRKYEPKPIRVFLQDGTNDLNIYAGDWWKANETMERALSFAGYEVNHVWGEGAHNGSHATAIFPEAMRWLWKDWPKPVSKGKSNNTMLSEILIPGEDWSLVGQGYTFTEGIATTSAGEVYFQDIPNSKTYRIDKNGSPQLLPLDAKKANGTVFDSKGNRYTASSRNKLILQYDASDKEKIIVDSLAANDLIIGNNGNLYTTVPDGTEKPSQLWLIRLNGEKVLLDEGLKFANGICFTPDQSQLYVTESASHNVWIYQILADGTLTNKQRFGWLHVPDNSNNAWPDGIKCDRDGRVYVATNSGIQVLDQLGRVNTIIPLPPGPNPSNLCFGGPNFDIMYVTCSDKVYKRKVKIRGANAFEKPNKPNAPKL